MNDNRREILSLKQEATSSVADLTTPSTETRSIFKNYSQQLETVLSTIQDESVTALYNDLLTIRKDRKQVFICGNGGSAANALHWATDFMYGAAKNGQRALRAHALVANSSAVTCIGNDLSYINIFSEQLHILGEPGDLLIVLSGSGNSPNVIKAIEIARTLGITTWAVVGYDGGVSKKIADKYIHFNIDDMQISEDCQQVLGHVLTKMLAVGIS